MSSSPNSGGNSAKGLLKSQESPERAVTLTCQLEMDLSQAAGRFSDDLLKLVVPQNHAANALVSPLSILTALSMLLLGSKNSSKESLMNALRLPSNVTQPQVDDYYHTLISAWKANANEGEKLLINNIALVKDSGRQLLPEYKDALKNKYQAEIEQVNFDTGGEALVNKVNNWVNSSTEGLIPTLLNSPPDQETVMMLLNAVYFKSEWLKRFYGPIEDDFHVNDSVKKKAQFISRDAEFYKYLEVPVGSDNEKIKLISIPYKGKFNMVVLLPPKSQNVNSLFSQHSITGMVKQLLQEKTREVHLTLPKFKFTSKAQMNEHLIALGAGDVFTSSADLSGITGEKDLKVSNIKHLTAIEVDEYGTKAAAVTSIEIVPLSAVYRNEEPIELKLNRPFVFVIYDTDNQLPIFVGKLNDPTA